MIYIEGDFSGIGVDSNRVLDQVSQVVALSLEANLKRNTPIDTGRLRGNYQHDKTGTGRWVISNNVQYLLNVNDGTGIYGPTGKPIEPVTAKCLVFTVGGKTIFSKSVKGQKGQHFVETSVDETVSQAQNLAEIAINRVLSE